MCIGSNSVNQAQDLMIETKIEDLPNSLLPKPQFHLHQLRKHCREMGGSKLSSCFKILLWSNARSVLF